VIRIVQDSLAVKIAGQVFISAKSAEPAPPIWIAERAAEEFPVFVKVASSTVDVLPMAVGANAILVRLSTRDDVAGGSGETGGGTGATANADGGLCNCG